MKKPVVYSLATFFYWLSVVFVAQSCQGQGTIEIEFSDQDSFSPISARLLFTKSPRKVTRPRKLLPIGEQWLAEKSFPLSLPNGEYEFLVQRGPEFKEIRGGFTIETKAKDVVSVQVPRAVFMHAENWYSGDHLTSLPLPVLKRFQAAEALDFALSTLQPDALPKNSAANQDATPRKSPNPKRKTDDDSPAPGPDDIGLQMSLLARRVDWQHGSILIHSATPGAPKSVEASSKLEASQALESAFQTSANDQWIELLGPWQRDVPILLATDRVRAVQILSEGNRRASDDRIEFAKSHSGKYVNGKIKSLRGKERMESAIFAPIPVDDTIRYSDGRGLGSMTEYLYWQMLEAGFRMPPTAGSHFNVNDSILGYNRVYVFAEETPTPTSWTQNILQGRTTVTNGPLLRTMVNGMPPGTVQASYRGQSISVDIDVSLTVREPVDYLGVIFNGQTIYSAPLEDHYKKGEFPPIEIDQSGWMVVRVITGHDQGYRLATTAPFYFEFDSKPRISRSAVEFFETWLARSIEDIQTDPSAESIQPYLVQAQQFWANRRDACTAD